MVPGLYFLKNFSHTLTWTACWFVRWTIWAVCHLPILKITDKINRCLTMYLHVSITDVSCTANSCEHDRVQLYTTDNRQSHTQTHTAEGKVMLTENTSYAESALEFCLHRRGRQLTYSTTWKHTTNWSIMISGWSWELSNFSSNISKVRLCSTSANPSGSQRCWNHQWRCITSGIALQVSNKQ